jgi:hypothetical protein
MPTDFEIITAKLKEMQDLIEVASFMQKKMQETDGNISRQEVRQGNISRVLGALGE